MGVGVKHFPDAVASVGIGGKKNTAARSFDQITAAPVRMGCFERSEGNVVNAVGNIGFDFDQFESLVGAIEQGNLFEIGPDAVIENKLAEVVEGLFQGIDFQGDFFLGYEQVGQKRNVNDMIEMRMGQKDMFDTENIVTECIDQVAGVDYAVFGDVDAGRPLRGGTRSART